MRGGGRVQSEECRVQSEVRISRIPKSGSIANSRATRKAGHALLILADDVTMTHAMTGNDLIQLGFRPGRAIGVALRLIPETAKSLDAAGIERELRAVLADPVRNATHPYFS